MAAAINFTPWLGRDQVGLQKNTRVDIDTKHQTVDAIPTLTTGPPREADAQATH